MSVIEKLEDYSAAKLYAIDQNGGINKGDPISLKTTTKVRFNEDNLLAKIRDENSEEEVEIGEFNMHKIKDLNKDPKAVRFLQALFGTEDNLEKILDTLARLGKVNLCEVLISTPKPEYRKAKKDRYVGFYFGKKILHIDLYEQ